MKKCSVRKSQLIKFQATFVVMKFFITPLVNEISKKNLRGIRRNYSCSLRAVYLTIGKGHGKKFRIKVTRDEISSNFYYNNIFHNPTHFRDMSEKLATYRKKKSHSPLPGSVAPKLWEILKKISNKSFSCGNFLRLLL